MGMIRAASLLAVAALLMAPASAAMAASVDTTGDDLTIVSGRRALSSDEVRQSDVTDQPAGQAILIRLAGDPDTAWVTQRPARTFVFGGQEVAVGAATPLAVFTGLNAAGKQTYEVYPIAAPIATTARAGFEGPPDGSSAWVYNASNFFSNTYNNWQRNIAWTIMAAWNYKLCSSCTAYQYFRIYGQIQGGTLTGQNSTWRRLWLEFDSHWDYGSPANFEFGQPEETVFGPNNVTITVGFGNSLSVTLGKAPLTATGGVNTTYSGTMSVPTEYWYPVLRSKVASGGVGYCRVYDWNGTRKIATRQAVRQAVNAQLGSWGIAYGMQQSYNGCP
jgi:hypothetical protein